MMLRVKEGARWTTLVMSVLVLTVVGCGGGGSPGGDAADAEEPFYVIQEKPTNRQEVLADLSDVGGRVEIEFSTNLSAQTVLDANNPFNGLSPDVHVLDSTLMRVAGTPSVSGEFLRFTPPASGLSAQQYTVTVGQNVRSAGEGQSLDSPFYTTFTVGPDVYAPVIRKTFPVDNQNDVPQDAQIVITFNEPLAEASVSDQTVLIQDGGQNPPVQVPGDISLRNNGYEIVFTPDPSNTFGGLPANSTVIVTLTGGSGGIVDRTAGNSADWQGDMFSFQFNTIELPPEPLGQIAPLSTYFIAGDEVGILDHGAAAGFTSITPDGQAGVIPDSRTRVGSPSDLILDARLSAAGDTFLYVSDIAGNRVVVLNTFNMRIVGEMSAQSPRGLAFWPGGDGLLVSQFNDDSVQHFDVSNAVPGTNGWAPFDPSVPTHSSNASAIPRFKQAVGRGPTGIAQNNGYYIVCNSIGGTASGFFLGITGGGSTIHDVEFATGGSPTEVAISPIDLGGNFMGLIVSPGDANNPAGSATLWWNGQPTIASAFLTDGIQAPQDIVTVGSHVWLIANSAGNHVSLVDARQLSGIGIFNTIIIPAPSFTLGVGESFTVGNGPASIATTGTNDGGFLVMSANTVDNTITFHDILEPGAAEIHAPVSLGARKLKNLAGQ